MIEPECTPRMAKFQRLKGVNKSQAIKQKMARSNSSTQLPTKYTQQTAERLTTPAVACLEAKSVPPFTVYMISTTGIDLLITKKNKMGIRTNA
jgi:hypothetical protein